MALARIGLGSNALQSPRAEMTAKRRRPCVRPAQPFVADVRAAAAHVVAALGALRQLGTVSARSRLYRSPAWGVSNQPDFVNAAALLQTALAPRELLAALKTLEGDLGRIATYRWGPRIIDLDILAYDDITFADSELIVPHPRLHERAFALVPLAEIDPAFRTARDALPAAERASIVPLTVAPPAE